MRISDPQVQQFIRQSMVARIATLSHNGRPSMTPLYFNHVDGHIWLGTSSWTLAARQANADPRVCLLLQRERNKADHRVLRISGTAIVRTDDRSLRLRDRQMALKYVFSPAALLNQLLNLRLFQLVHRYRAQSANKGPSCVIDVTPQHVDFV